MKDLFYYYFLPDSNLSREGSFYIYHSLGVLQPAKYDHPVQIFDVYYTDSVNPEDPIVYYHRADYEITEDFSKLPIYTFNEVESKITKIVQFYIDAIYKEI